MYSRPPRGSKYAAAGSSFDHQSDVDMTYEPSELSRKPSSDSHAPSAPEVGQHRTQTSAASTSSMVYSDSSLSDDSSEFETADEEEEDENGQRTLASMPFRMRDGQTGTGSTYLGAQSARVLLCVNAIVHILHHFDEAPGKRLHRIRYRDILPLTLALYEEWDIDVEVGIDDVLELPMFASSVRATRVRDVEGRVVDIINLFRDLGTRALLIASEDRAVCVLPSITKERTVDEAGLTVFTLDDEEGHRYKHAAFLAYASRSQAAQAILRILNKGKRTTPLLQYCVLSQIEASDPTTAVYRSNIRLLDAMMRVRDLDSDHKSYQREISIAERNINSETTKMGHAIEATDKLNEEMKKLQSDLDNTQRMTDTMLHEQLRGTPNPRITNNSDAREEEQRNVTGDKKGKKSGLFGFIRNIGSGGADDSSSHFSQQQQQRSRPSGSGTSQRRPVGGEASTGDRPTGTRSQPKARSSDRSSRRTLDPRPQESMRLQNEYDRGYGDPVDDSRSNGKGKGRVDETKYWDYAPPGVDPSLQEALRLQAQFDREEELSRELAMRMQEIERAEAELFADLQRREIRNQPFDCDLCAETCPASDLAIIEQCEHITCRYCLLRHVKAQISEARWPIWCPMCPPGQKKRGVVTRWLAEIVGADDKVFEQWNRMEVAGLGIDVECPNCKISTIVDAEDFGAVKSLDCPVGCGAHWCKDCNQQIARGGVHSCDGELEFKDMLARNPTVFRRCPNGHLIEKNLGCDHMHCTTCRVDFSWNAARQ